MTHVSPGDPPVYLRYGTPLQKPPLPESTPIGVSIHHANFGKLLQDRCRGRDVECYLACRGVRPKISEQEFALRLLSGTRQSP